MAATMDIENAAMFCMQCEQTARNKEGVSFGCTLKGVCQKDAETAGLQDHLIYGLECLSSFAYQLEDKDFTQDLAYHLAQCLFATLTNVNFAAEDFVAFIEKTYDEVKKIQGKLPADKMPKFDVASWVPDLKAGKAGLTKQARDYLISKRFAKLGKDRVCLQELIVYGLKGVAAYAHHSAVLGSDIRKEMKAVAKLLGYTIQIPDPSVDVLLAGALEVGEINYAIMRILDGANTGHYGNPEPTTIDWVMINNQGAAPKPGKCILVSGHDLLELERLLTQIEAKEADIHVYTHGEMLPANAYPALKAHKALVGHYGTAWQNQKAEFAAFPGPIVMTTNCYIPAPSSYLSRVFGCNPVGGNGVTPIVDGDYSPVIASAMANAGFPEKNIPAAPGKKLTIGFAHNTVMSVADKVIGAVKTGGLKRIFLIGGCDGFEKERNVYTEFAELVPEDCLILTLACGKFKINQKDYGMLGDSGIPRLLDMGQCNDSYSAIQVAIALAGAFKCGVNDLPLSIILSWFEQKAVAVLLTLLHLGIKNIYVGPRVPAFFTPTILNVLVDKFQLHVLTDAKKDLATTLGQK